MRKRDHRRSKIDGWKSTRTPRIYKKPKKKPKPYKAQVCRFCGGPNARKIEDVGLAHKTCFWVWNQANGGKATMLSKVGTLSTRQREMIRLQSLGCTNREIGKILGMSRLNVVQRQQDAKHRLGVPVRMFPRIAIEYRIAPYHDRLTEEEKAKLEST